MSDSRTLSNKIIYEADGSTKTNIKGVDAAGSAHNLNLGQYKITIAEIRLPARMIKSSPIVVDLSNLNKMEITRILIPLRSILLLKLVTPQLKI